jgi:hypothetical protein
MVEGTIRKQEDILRQGRREFITFITEKLLRYQFKLCSEKAMFVRFQVFTAATLSRIVS